MKRFKSAGQAQRFLSAHGGNNNFLHLRRDQVPANQYRTPGPRPSRFGPRSPASPLRCNHGHDVITARHRDLSLTSLRCQYRIGGARDLHGSGFQSLSRKGPVLPPSPALSEPSVAIAGLFELWPESDCRNQG